MESLEGFDYFPLRADRDGRIQKQAEQDALIAHVKQAAPSDVVFIAHGFRNDENDARRLYSAFLRSFRAHLARPELAGLQGRELAVCGFLWPAKAFRESFDEGGVQSTGDEDAEKREARRRLEELKETDAGATQRPKLERAIELLDTVEESKAAQDELVDLVLSLLDEAEIDATEGLDKIRTQEGSHLLELLEEELVLPLAEPPRDEGGVLTVDAVVGAGDGQTEGLRSVFGSIFGRIGQLLNLTTWYLMKSRAGEAGARAAAATVAAVADARPATRIHLVGHSLGGRLVAACAKGLAERGRKVDSLTLLQAAFSHYGLSRTRGNQPGFFRPVVDKKVVKGPLISTFSVSDSVVGNAYAIASRLANDNTRAIGDANDEFGGIGRNGAQNASNSTVEKLHVAGQAYSFSPDLIINLDGSGGLIADHSDVTNANVTYAFAAAVART